MNKCMKIIQIHANISLAFNTIKKKSSHKQTNENEAQRERTEKESNKMNVYLARSYKIYFFCKK